MRKSATPVRIGAHSVRSANDRGYLCSEILKIFRQPLVNLLDLMAIPAHLGFFAVDYRIAQRDRARPVDATGSVRQEGADPSANSAQQPYSRDQRRRLPAQDEHGCLGIEGGCEPRKRWGRSLRRRGWEVCANWCGRTVSLQSLSRRLSACCGHDLNRSRFGFATFCLSRVARESATRPRLTPQSPQIPSQRQGVPGCASRIDFQHRAWRLSFRRNCFWFA